MAQVISPSLVGNRSGGDRTYDEMHMQELLDALPHMKDIRDRLAAHREATQVYATYQCVEDLEQALEILESRNPIDTPEGPRLYGILLSEKRSALTRERARLDHNLAHSRFSTIAEVSHAMLPAPVVRFYEEEFNHYREDYAYTFARCQSKEKTCR